MTRTLTLKNRFQGNTTIVENDFIDNYIAKANGEYVKEITIMKSITKITVINLMRHV
jgi:hypothetical protein